MNIISLILIIQFQFIPTEYLELRGLYKYFSPPDSIVWWRTGVCNLSSQKYKVFFCTDSNEKADIPKFSKLNTYSSKFHTLFPNHFFLFYKTNSGKLGCIDKVEEVPVFIGKIDNLPKALFLVSLYGYTSSSEKKNSSYYHKNGYFIMNFYKIPTPIDVLPITKLNKNGQIVEYRPEYVKVKVETTGIVYEISGGKKPVYKKLGIKDMY